MPGTARRPEIAPLAFMVATPFVVVVALVVVVGYELAPLRDMLDDTSERERLLLGAVGVWGLLQVLPYLLYLWGGVAMLMAAGAGSAWLLSRLLQLPARGVSWAALGWLGWLLGLLFTALALGRLLGKGHFF